VSPHRSVRPPAEDRAARRRLVWLLLRNGDIAAEPLWSERAARREEAPRAPGGRRRGAADRA
jgi:hypothetical protein